MVEKLRLGRRAAVGVLVLLAVVFGLVGQGAHRAAADGASVVSISGSPEVAEGSPATFTATITPAAAVDFNVTYTASAGAVGGTFHVATGDTSVDFPVQTQDNGFPDASPRPFTVTLQSTDASDGSTVDSTPANGLLDNIDPPSSVVSIGNAPSSATEGSPVTFPVKISPAAGVAFNVNYSASAGGVSGSFHVSQGATSLQVPVATVDDSTPQGDRTLTVTLTGTDASNGSTASGSGTGTIIDNDWTITLSPINPPAVSEKGGSIQFTATLNAKAVANHAISVNYAVTNGTAVLGTNYTVGQPSGTFTFAPGAQTSSVTVTGVDDGVYLAGAGKTFTMTLSSPHGATISGSASSTGTINDADAPPLLGISTCGGGFGTVTGGSPAIFRVLVQAASVPASVHYTTVPGTTIAGDYDASSGTLTIPPGSTREADLTVATHSIAPAGSRTFSVQLSNLQGAAFLSSSVSCTIASNGSGTSTLPAVQIANPPPVVEPASGSTPAVVTVQLSAPAAQSPTPKPVHIHYQTADGTAVSPTDYTAASGDLTWSAGTYSSQTFQIQVNSNPALTAPATFTIAFTSPDGSAGFVGTATATVTVLPVGSTASVLSIAGASAPEHAGAIPAVVTLTPAGTAPVTVHYATADGQGGTGAVAGRDYTAESGTLTFAPGDTTKTVSIPITPYSTVQPNRSFQVVLSSPTGATISTATATLTILNDNVPPSPPPTASSSPPQPKPVPIPQKQQDTAHLVQVQMLTGESRADSKGRAVYQISCPEIVIRLCAGTVAFDVRVQAAVPKGSKKKPQLKTLRVGTGKFSVHSGKTGTVTITLTKQGLQLVQSVKRLRVKATITAKDGAGVKGTTAWYVSVSAPAAPKKKTKSVRLP